MGKIKDVKSFLGTDEITTSLDLWKALIAEYIGTLFLVFVGCGSCVGKWDERELDSSVVQIALAFGIAVATMAQVCFCFS